MKKLALILNLILLLFHIAAFSQVTIQSVSCENLTNPIGLDLKQPRFSWVLASPGRNVLQSAYEIHVSKEAASLSKGDVWNSGRVQSDQSVFVPYGGPALVSGEKYFWQVKVWDNSGKASAWSAPAFWQMGLLNPSDWKAKWIQVTYKEDETGQPSPLFRKEFKITKKIKSATAYITALGLYEASLNGKRIGDAYLTPGWTSYNKRLQYQQYDVTGLLKDGDNVIGAMLGNGWYRGFIGFEGQKNYYGKELGLLLQLTLNYTDGTSETIGTDTSWKCSTGSVVASEIYNGETVDNRKEKAGWNTAGYKDADWLPVRIAGGEPVKIIATYNEPIRKKEFIKAVKMITTPKGEKVIDFGQNLTGWVQLKVKGNAGDKISIYHAEVLDKQGNFYIANLRPAKQLNTFILKGGAEESFEPRFTFQGFRYIKVESTLDLKMENFTAVVLYSDMKTTGTFTCSNPLINQLQHNIQWGQKGNFLDVPTDCPQRDERLGWTGDAQAFSRTAAFNMDVHNFFVKWLKDVEADQIDGSVPWVVPNVLGPNAAGSAGWADAATIIPWNMYLAYGDKKILEEQYSSMKAWVDWIHRKSVNYLWNSGFHFGDWLFYRPFDDNEGLSAVTDKYLIAQTFFAHSTQLLINTANVLGKKDEAAKYSELLQKVKEAFNKEYVTSSGRLVSSTQTAYVLALNFDMLPENQRQAAAQRLVDNIKAYNMHLTTGFLGTPYLTHVLTRFGYTDVAYSLLLQETYPSWLYPVKMGATTIWERWDGIKPDSTFQTPTMNSFNHYAYGAIGDWMYRTVGGLDTRETAPGYKEIVIKPFLDKRLTKSTTLLTTPYGKAGSDWAVEGNNFSLSVTVPVNSRATVYLPNTSEETVRENGTPVQGRKDLLIKGKDGDYLMIEVGSGAYKFTSVLK
jgi:alpha-L-rhamnosidase